MLYIVTYKRRADRDPYKWQTFTEPLSLEDMNALLKWLERRTDNHELISIMPAPAY